MCDWCDVLTVDWWFTVMVVWTRRIHDRRVQFGDECGDWNLWKQGFVWCFVVIKTVLSLVFCLWNFAGSGRLKLHRFGLLLFLKKLLWIFGLLPVLSDWLYFIEGSLGHQGCEPWPPRVWDVDDSLLLDNFFWHKNKNKKDPK